MAGKQDALSKLEAEIRSFVDSVREAARAGEELRELVAVLRRAKEAYVSFERKSQERIEALEALERRLLRKADELDSNLQSQLRSLSQRLTGELSDLKGQIQADYSALSKRIKEELEAERTKLADVQHLVFKRLDSIEDATKTGIEENREEAEKAADTARQAEAVARSAKALAGWALLLALAAIGVVGWMYWAISAGGG